MFVVRLHADIQPYVGMYFKTPIFYKCGIQITTFLANKKLQKTDYFYAIVHLQRGAASE
jgi:hypothetical protein